MKRAILALLLGMPCAWASMRVIVTVVEQKSGRPVEDLSLSDFIFIEDKVSRKIEAAEFARKPVDVMLLVDTSLVGPMVQPVASSLIAELKDKEQMAIVSFDSSAELIQDYTSSKQLLAAALGKVKYGNTPKVLDALYAAMDGGFRNTFYRRVIVLVTAGLEGNSRASEKDVIRFAQKNNVSIFTVFTAGSGKSMFDNLARRTGGASFLLRDLQRNSQGPPAARILDVVRGHYTLTLTGNLGLSEKVRVQVKRPEKLFLSVLPLD
jgi:VWFA-related protein